MPRKKEAVPLRLLSKEFLSRSKTEADVSKFLKDLHSQILEQMLEGKMESHLGYAKHSQRETTRATLVTGHSEEDPNQAWRERDPGSARPSERVRPCGRPQVLKPRIIHREARYLALRKRYERVGHRGRATGYLRYQSLYVGNFNHHEQGYPDGF